MFTCNFEKLGSRKLRRLPQIADFKARNRLRTRCDTAFVGIIVPSLWGGLGRGLTLLFFSGGHIGPHPTKRLQRTGHAQSLLLNSQEGKSLLVHFFEAFLLIFRVFLYFCCCERKIFNHFNEVMNMKKIFGVIALAAAFMFAVPAQAQ